MIGIDMDREEYPFDILRLRTTPMGEERIRRNLMLSENIDAVKFCRNFILDDNAVYERKGKNWYITTGHVRITVNAGSLTIITAHQI